MTSANIFIYLVYILSWYEASLKFKETILGSDFVFVPWTG